MTIDLHGYKHWQAKQELELFINDHWGLRIKVITGHSPTMVKIVISLCSTYNLDYLVDTFGTYVVIIEH